MLDQQIKRWTAIFDEGMASEEAVDMEPLWNEVGAAIEANPDHAGLRRLHIRMAETFGEHASRHADLLALHRIDPANRADWLELAVAQHRWAFMLAPEDEEEERVDEEADDAEPVITVRMRALAEADAETAQGALEREARGWLAQLIREHRSDTDFVVEVFARWDDARIYAPWLRLTLALEAAAAHPTDARVERVLALAWEDLANQSPEGYDPEQAPLPMGFMIDVTGTLWDPFIQERALNAIGRLLERDPGDIDLLGRRARLLEARCDFPAAAEAYATAQEAAVRTQASAQSDEAREEFASLATDFGDRAELCRGGRTAIASAMVNGMADAVARLREPTPRREGASAAAEAFAADMDKTMVETAREFDVNLEALRATLPGHEASEEKIGEMHAAARQIAANIVASVQFEPLEKVTITPADFEENWAEALRPVREAFAALGWRDLGWAEWPYYRAMLGHQAVSSMWTDPEATTVAIAFSAKGTLSLDLETELDDAGLVGTSLSRGRNFFDYGPEMDILFVEPTLSIPEACELHRVRVAVSLSRKRSAALRCSSDLAEVMAMQERGRELKTRIRLANGISESESLGVPHDFPELFAPLLREAVNQGMGALRPKR